jgi:hypothetical protein
MKMNFFAGYSYMGVNFTYGSPCWSVFMFGSKKDRDEWVAQNEYADGNVKAQAITQKIAYRILGVTPARLRQGWHICGSMSGRPYEVMFC